ncbi:hypothetical protein IWZ03DRAFT_191003 [Phyllosticta citriasiana]|uniref:GPI-anchored cell surface glycoprotein n=1 Tax=Phyllosticta citriasiana TaxID=595635 RepID=A0ABR1KQ57_9PEZI
MSLNGLDQGPVQEAYQAALADAGGWFLLKYASRDALDVLGLGTAGVNEARAALLDYEEKSPLYGLVHHRRRKLLLKYIPEGTSRLLQARVTVHFQEIEERFSHDTIFSFSSPLELTENALAAASSLHTEASSSSSTSSKSKKLDGISEHVEDVTDGAGAEAPLARIDTGLSSLQREQTKEEAPTSARPLSPTGHADTMPQSPGAATIDSKTGSPRAYAQSVRSLNAYDYLSNDDPQRRASSSTARPEYDFSYLYKPKVKLGPRPMDSRPHTAGDGKSAKLPPSLKAAVRNKANLARPKSRESSTVPSIAVPPPVPQMLDMPSSAPDRPTSSPGLRSNSASSAKSTGITPEKQRLLRAVELRKKQMKAAQAAKEKTGANEAASADPDRAADATAGAEAKGAGGEGVEVPREQTPSTDSAATLNAASGLDHTKADSGVEVLISGAGDEEEEEEEEEEARPPTPIVSSSPISFQESAKTLSTRPSSVSEGGEHKDAVDGAERRRRVDGGFDGSSLGVPSVDDPSTNQDVSSPDRDSSGDHQAESTQGPRPSDDNTTALPAAASPSPTPKRHSTQNRRSRNVDLIRVGDPSAEISDEDYMSDDSFMEELQSATVEEAKPMSVSVSKSPITSIFPRRKGSSTSTISIEQRVNSNPLSSTRGNSQRPSPDYAASQRSLSASYAGSKENAPVTRKTGVSSGIAQRMKALAEKSNREATHMVPRRIGNDPGTNSLVAQRQNSLRASSADAYLKNSRRLSKSSFISVAPSDRPTSRGSNSNEPVQAVYNKGADSKTESVTVTARIVRTPAPGPRTPQQEHETSPLDLQPSPITIETTKQEVQPSPVVQPSPSKEVSSPHSATAPPVIFSPQREALPRSSSESSWRSLGRRRSEISSPPQSMPRSQSVASFDSVAESAESKDERKGSRTSRLLKRMSTGFSAASRKSLNQMVNSNPTVQEEVPEEELPTPKSTAVPAGLEIGELNVQFPDNLLWKRRHVEIDAQGNIVLSPSKANDTKGLVKRYHLGEFLAPFAPDAERQEMPNSVLLDFHDGRTLQCACESAAGQVQVLNLLRTAHAAWTQK